MQLFASRDSAANSRVLTIVRYKPLLSCFREALLLIVLMHGLMLAN